MFGFRKRPQFSEVLEYINEGEPLNFDLPRRNATIYKSSLFYLDDFPQSTEPLAENPRPHTQLGAAVEDDFESADDGYQGRPFPQMRRPNFLRPGPDTDTEDEAYRRHGFNPPRPPDPGHPSSSFSGRVGEAAAAGVTGIIAAGTNGVGQAAQNFGFTNATKGQRTQWSSACSLRSSAGQQTRNVSSSRQGKERKKSKGRRLKTSSNLRRSRLLQKRQKSRPCWPKPALGQAKLLLEQLEQGHWKSWAAPLARRLRRKSRFLRPLVWPRELEEPWPAARADRRLARRRHLQAAAGWEP